MTQNHQIQLFEERKVRSVWDDEEERWGTSCSPTHMLASDGKYYKTQATDLEGIFRIIQSIPSPKAIGTTMRAPHYDSVILESKVGKWEPLEEDILKG